MSTFRINVAERYQKPLVIGYMRENEIVQVEFEMGDWIEKYGSGTVSLSVQRQRDKNPYPVPLAVNSDGIAVWTISNVDTAQLGRAKAQLTYSVGAKVKKTRIYDLSIRESLVEDGAAPEPYESWLEILQGYTSETSANAESARQGAADAAASASAAADSELSASNAAQAAEGSANAASQAAEASATSASDAERYAELAGQHASEAGYAFFDVNESDGKLYVTKTDSFEDLDFVINENTGSLEVVINE